MMQKQRCLLVNVYVSWLVYGAALAYALWRGKFAMAAALIVAVPLAQWLYIRGFPRISRLMGYGDVTDTPASSVAKAPVKVTLYTAVGCPFCPLLEQRLAALEKSAGFTLEKIDVTLRPDLLTSKGIRSVPVVEIGETRLIGLATSAELAAALGGGKVVHE